MPKVLIVDAEAETVTRLRALLASEDYEVLTAPDGPEALQKVRDEHPQTVLLALRLPTMSGLEVLRQLRGLDPTVTVIVLAGHQESRSAWVALALGACDCLATPVDLRELRRSLRAHPHPGNGRAQTDGRGQATGGPSLIRGLAQGQLPSPFGGGGQEEGRHLANILERRRAPRVPVAEGVTVRVRASLLFEVRLLDLSLVGARIAHRDLLRPGSPSVVEFVPTLGLLTLAAHVARSCVVGTQPTLVGERQLCYESGLAFAEVRADQQVKLADILERLALIGDGGVRWQEVREVPGAVIWLREVRLGWWAVAATFLPALAGNGSRLAPPAVEMILPAGYESHTAAMEAAKRYLDREQARRLHQPGRVGGK